VNSGEPVVFCIDVELLPSIRPKDVDVPLVIDCPETRAVLSKTTSFGVPFDRLLRYQTRSRRKMIASPTEPPNTPPTIAPIFGELEERLVGDGAAEPDDNKNETVTVLATVSVGNNEEGRVIDAFLAATTGSKVPFVSAGLIYAHWGTDVPANMFPGKVDSYFTEQLKLHIVQFKYERS